MATKTGDYFIYSLADLDVRKKYDTQIEAEIRCRNEHVGKNATFRKGAVVVKVVSIVTEDKVESIE